MGKKKVALFGGYFNPINNMDIDVVKEVFYNGLVDEVWFVPYMQHQFDYELVDGNLRSEMIELAVKELGGKELVFGDNVKVCREDLDSPGMISQYDIIRRLRKKFDYDFVWLGGSHLLHEFFKWYKFLRVLDMIDFIIYEEKGWDIVSVDKMRVIFILKPKVFVSSDEVRLRRMEGSSIGGIVPRSVEKFVVAKRLYEKVSLP